MHHLQPRGFTLIELLVVISIISLLIAMLLPSVEKARASGEQITCQTNLRQLSVAMETYVNDSHDMKFSTGCRSATYQPWSAKYFPWYHPF